MMIQIKAAPHERPFLILLYHVDGCVKQANLTILHEQAFSVLLRIGHVLKIDALVIVTRITRLISSRARGASPTASAIKFIIAGLLSFALQPGQIVWGRYR